MAQRVDESQEGVQRVSDLLLTDLTVPSLMGALQDAYQVQDQCTCEEEQGISPEDDEAKAIEAGEFCRPGIKLSPRPNPVREVDPMKRSEIGNPEESAPKRKKAKRV